MEVPRPVVEIPYVLGQYHGLDDPSRPQNGGNQPFLDITIPAGRNEFEHIRPTEINFR